MNIAKLFGLARAAVGVSDTQEPPDPTEGFTNDEVQRVALNYVYGKAAPAPDSFWGGTLQRCDEADVRIARLRAEYATHEPRRMRRAILSWLDYYQRQNDEARRDIETGAKRREMDEYRARREAEDARAQDLRDRLRLSQSQS